MRAIRSSLLIGGLLLSALASAQVQVQGPVEYGLFISNAKEFAPGERLLTRSDQVIEPTQVIPAKLGSKFGLRYSLAGKQAGDAPLTLLYLTPGVVTPDGLRHDKFVVQQPMVQGAGADLMAFEFSETYEVVPGEWRFMVFQGDRLLAEQTFEVR
ncbi:MAG: DUF3859 domain-containing protein [Pseudomonas sp.]|nr:DUF3859 domain-containing protein [Pseudomonas sp.]